MKTRESSISQPILFQRLEAALVLFASIYFYFHLGFSLLWFVLVLLAIDITAAGYLVSNVVGAKVYNLGHSYIIPSILLVGGTADQSKLLVGLGIIWTAHIAMDRAFGFGLKLPSGFKDTHLGHI